MAAKKDKDKRKDKGKDSHLHRIKELIDIMRDNDLVELEIKHGDEKICLKRSQPQPPAITAVPMVAPSVAAPSANSNTGQVSQIPAEVVASEARALEELAEIKSPLVGTFYSAPSPDSEPYVEVGSLVNCTTVVCIIEAMKVMNEIKSDISGTMAEILVKNGQAVEFGQVLFKVKPD